MQDHLKTSLLEGALSLSLQDLRETLALKSWTERTLTIETANYSTLIPRSELFYRSRIQEKADSSVEVHLWRRKKVGRGAGVIREGRRKEEIEEGHHHDLITSP
jgi:hypothetical protein